MSLISFYEKKESPAYFMCAEVLTELPHLHNEIEMIYVCKGTAVAIADKKSYKIEKGDLFICFPNQIHYYCSEANSKYYISIVSPNTIPELREKFVTGNPVSNVIRIGTDSPAARIFEEINTGYRNSVKPYRLTMLIGYLNLLFHEVFSELKLEPVTPYNTTLIKKIIEFCTVHYNEDLTLDTMAAELHINKYHISHLFHDKLQIGFNSFINSIRIHNACELLSGTEYNITEISQLSGFSTTRTFNSAFMKIMRQTPREYRNKYVAMKLQKDESRYCSSDYSGCI